ncbi:unnamed protein product [Arctia plantaginis]|uniref:Chitin-binding type-2 domain-containing protein n=1 Tax=Arctia plantaginis TaxID=874455 RepID=A0A8S1B751_ARCPL|nr:unnamed protein product [Arctia plantaginis]CAB3253961.1 unnamed protein product [Arctia plantaginis]
MWWKIALLLVFAINQSLTTSFDLRGVINGNRMAGVPLGMSLGAGELDVEGICIRSGMACQNCTVSITCVPLPVGWLKVPLEECKDGFTCNAGLGKCSKDAAPECEASARQFQHTCEQVGIFPDAYDCRKFHLCSPPEGLPDGRPADHRAALCPRHYGYNPQTAQCSIKLQNGQCSEKPVPECRSIGQNGVLPSSSNHYYVCLIKNQTLYPQIFICPHGWHFWGGFCQPEPEPKQNPVVTPESETNKETKESSEENSGKEDTVKTSTYKIDNFFSTEKVATYAADTFLADKFDLSNYETTDDVQPSQSDDFFNSFENDNDFW